MMKIVDRKTKRIRATLEDDGGLIIYDENGEVKTRIPDVEVDEDNKENTDNASRDSGSV